MSTYHDSTNYRPLNTNRLAHCALFLIVSTAAILRLPLLSGQRFHPDEALYATWARWIATGQDVWLAERVVDKPPLFIYLLAVPFSTLGASEEIARVPNYLASLGCILLVYAIARTLYPDRRIALISALALSLSPMAILFSPTAFTDPTMLLWGLASAWLGLRGRQFLSGLAFGLCLATKQDALLFLPFIALWLMTGGRALRARYEPARIIRALAPFSLGAAIPTALVVGWSMARPQPDFLHASLANYSELSLVTPGDYLTRALGWLQLARALSADWLLLLAVVSVPLVLSREKNKTDIFLVTASAYWLAVHLIVGFPIWDRYLLPLAPLTAWWLARCLWWWFDRLPKQPWRLALAACALLLLVLPVRSALRGEIHIARDFDRHAGMNQVGEFFWKTDTTATILYMHRLSWAVDYYTFGRALDRRWFETPDLLAYDAAHMWWANRYVVTADWEALHDALPAALARENLMAERVLVTYRADGRPAVHVYRIRPRTRESAGF